MKGKIKLLVTIGIIIALLPVLRFPRSFKSIILFILGLIIIFITISLWHGIKIIRLKLKRIEGQQGTLIQ